MEKIIYRKEEIDNWSDFLATNFANFLYHVYKGKPLPPEKDPHHITQEDENANLIFVLSDNKRVVGLTAVQVLPKMIDNKKVVFIWEIAVDRDFQGRGLGRDLRHWMIQEISPDIIFGIANNPISAISRAKITGRLGYETYWGNLIVGGGKQTLPIGEVDRLCRLLLSENPQQLTGYEDGLVPYTSGNIFADESQAVKGDSNVEKVFAKLLSIQKRTQAPYMATLISIRN